MFDGFDDEFVVPERKPRPTYADLEALQHLIVKNDFKNLSIACDKVEGRDTPRILQNTMPIISLVQVNTLVAGEVDIWADLTRALCVASTQLVNADYIGMLTSQVGSKIFGSLNDEEGHAFDPTKFSDLVKVFRWRCYQYIIKGDQDAYVDAQGSLDTLQSYRAALVGLLAAGALHLFVQLNWTGPEMSLDELLPINPLPYIASLMPAESLVAEGKKPAWYQPAIKETAVTSFAAEVPPAEGDDFDSKAIESRMQAERTHLAHVSLAALQVETQDAYEHIHAPHLLCTARALLVALTGSGEVSPGDDPRNAKLFEQSRKLWFISWIAGRAVVVHQRAIVDRTPSALLFQISVSHFRRAADGVCPHLARAFNQQDQFDVAFVEAELNATTATDAGTRLTEILKSDEPEPFDPRGDIFANESSVLVGIDSTSPASSATVQGGPGTVHSARSATSEQLAAASAHDSRTAAQLLLEWGHAQHFFMKRSAAKTSFFLAKRESAVQTLLTGALGRRTKFQKFDLSQLVLRARSQGQEADAAVTDALHAEHVGGGEGAFSAGKLRQLGIIAPAPGVATGDTASGLTAEAIPYTTVLGGIQQFKLDDVDATNILLEQPAFRDPSRATKTEEELQYDKLVYGKGWGASQERPIDAASMVHKAPELSDGPVSAFDQCIIMALCLDIRNHNPADGLTQAEMRPFVARALDTPLNWMVYSTGLLVKSLLEFESHRTMERAVLQMQALVDQHSNRLTPMQASQRAIDESAPARDRMRYIFGLVFPARWDLKRQLADKYKTFGVLRSALQLYEELEVWDEIIECHVALEKRKRAEFLLRKRIAFFPSPRLLCLLGQVVNDDQYFLEAWELSKHRYGKAQLELGRRYFARKEIAPAVGALQAGLTVSPHANKEWYFLGLICMQLAKHDVALTAFSKVVQLEPTSADAWANIGSIYLAKREWNRAYSAMEQALRMDRKDWRMWSNFLIACMQLRNFSRAIFVMHEMLDIKRRDADSDPINIGALGLLVQEVLQSLEVESVGAPKPSTTIATADVIEDAAALPTPTSMNSTDAESLEECAAETLSNSRHMDIAGLPCSRYLESVAKLFGHITSVVTNQPKIWHLYSIVQKARGRSADATECKLKMCRALQTAGWEKDEACVTALARASEQLVSDYINPRTAQSTLQARMYLTAVLGKIDAARVFASHPAVAPLRSLLQSVDPPIANSETK